MIIRAAILLSMCLSLPSAAEPAPPACPAGLETQPGRSYFSVPNCNADPAQQGVEYAAGSLATATSWDGAACLKERPGHARIYWRVEVQSLRMPNGQCVNRTQRIGGWIVER